MRKVTITYPADEGESPMNIPVEVTSFLLEAIVLGDLCVTQEEIETLSISTPEFIEPYWDGEETFDIYKVELSGDDMTIQEIENWQTQFSQKLQ